MNDVGGSDGGSDLSRQLRRWGPVGVIAVVIIAVVIGLAVSGGDDDGDTAEDVTTDTGSPDTTGTDQPGTTDTGSPDTSDTGEPDDPTADLTADGVVTWGEAEAAGANGEFDWGDRCDTDLGTLAYPSFFAGECVVPFTGDNGGATSAGVTADSVKVVVYLQPEVDPVYDYITSAISNDDTPGDVFETQQGLTDFYGSFFETYGRTVELVRYDATGTSDDEVAAIADAETIARDIQPFMVWGAPTLRSEVFAETLASNGVMCACGTGATARDNYPYLHFIAKSAEQSRVLLAEYIGKRLAGRNAAHSGDYVDQERKFAYLYIETSDLSTDVANGFRDRLRDEYGVDLATLVPYTLDPQTIQEQATTIMSSLKSEGVTSVIFAGDAVAPRDFTIAATEQEYFPEWVLAGTALVDTNAFARTYDPQQWQHAFGMSNTAVPVAREEEGYYHLYEWFNGEPPPAIDTIGVLWQPSVFFAGLQLTGPDLTPQHYMDALMASPPTARGAISQPSISWGNDKGIWPEEILPDLDGIDDVSEIWWDPDTEGPDELDRIAPGVYQYVGGGTRYLPGQWPDTEPDVFNPDNAEYYYETPPPGENPPDYPSPAG